MAVKLFGYKSVRGALKLWGDAQRLGEHPLAELAVVLYRAEKYGNDPAGRGLALRELLRELIGELKPAGDTPNYDQKAWRLYTILHSQYIQQHRAIDIRHQLTLSESGYFKDQRTALSLLGEQLQIVNSGQSVVDSVGSQPHPQSPPATSHQPPATHFIGREDEIRQIHTLLNSAECRLLTLVGPGGVGKTRLAMETAGELARQFPQGVYFVGLAPLQSQTEIMTEITQALGVTVSDNGAGQTALGDFLRQKQLLLILDNFEHVMSATSLVAELLGQAPAMKVLATSRERLNVRGEWVLELAGLRVPAGTATNYQTYSAVQLFLSTAQRIHGGQPLDKHHEPHIARICQLVQGTPLALELAASWTSFLSPAEIVSEIEQGLDFLDGTLRDVPERHQSLRAVFNHSWALLSGQEQAVFSRLSIFRGHFTREAAKAVAGADLAVLFQLRNKSLLKIHPAGGYEVHELLRQFAEEKLTSSSATQHAYATYYIHFLTNRTSALKQGDGQQQTLAEIEKAFANLRAACFTALDQHNDELLLQAVEPLYLAFMMFKRFREGAEAFERVITHLQARPGRGPLAERLLGMALVIQGRFHFLRGRRDTAQTRLLAGLPLIAKQGSPREKALTYLFAIQANLDAPFAPAGLFETCQALFGELGDTWGVAMAHYEWGAFLYRVDQEPGRATQHVTQSLTLHRQINNAWGSAMCLHHLGHVAYASGDYPHAKQYTEQSLAICTHIGDHLGVADAYNSLGHVAGALGQLPEAQDYYTRCLTIRQELGDRIRIAECLDCLGYITYLLGDDETAEHHYRQSLQISQTLEDQSGTAWSFHNLGDIARRRKKYAKAKRLYDESQDLHQRKDPYDWGRVVALEKLGRVTLALNQQAEAQHWFTEALRIAIHTQRYREALDSLFGLAQLYEAKGQSRLANQCLTTIIQHPATAKDTRDKAELNLNSTTKSHEITLPELVSLILSS